MAAKKTTAAVEAELEHVEQMCAEHFPHGWRHVADHHVGVACEHGSWTRDEPAQTPESPTGGTDPEQGSNP